MKIIDLLNKISNGEEAPKKIKCDGEEYKITKILLEDNNYWLNYINEDMECIFPINTNHLNDEVEVIENNKKIEKINWKEKESLAGFIRNDNDKLDILARRTEKLKKSLNEIIEVLNDKN